MGDAGLALTPFPLLLVSTLVVGSPVMSADPRNKDGIGARTGQKHLEER